jgi:serine/threonine protein kinase
MQTVTTAAELKLLQKIGGGGFGTVWKGRRTSSGIEQDVAVKILKTDVAQHEEFVHRLKDEARLLARLKHHAIVKMVDFTTIDDLPAVIIEYIEGADLKELLKAGPIPLRPLLQIGMETASALAEAHKATDARTGALLNLIHRDIKPENLRLTPRGEVKVLDFGIAKATFQEREAQTGSMFVGSKGYIPPERLLMQEGQGVDVFALGLVLAEAFSGKAAGQCPLKPDNVPVWLDKYRVWQQGWLGQLEAAPEPFRRLIKQMTEFDPDKRPNMEAVENALEELVRRAEGPRLKDWMAEALSGAPRTGPSGSIGTLHRTPSEELRSSSLDSGIRASKGTWLVGGAGVAVFLLGAVVCMGGLVLGNLLWPEGTAPVKPTTTVQPAATVQPVVQPVVQPTTQPAPQPTAQPASQPPAQPTTAQPVPVRTTVPVATLKATPIPVAAPAPVAQPAATPPPVPHTGSIAITGAKGSLKGGGSLSSVSEGTHTVVVSFPSGSTKEFPVHVTAGQTTTLTCSGAMERCK